MLNPPRKSDRITEWTAAIASRLPLGAFLAPPDPVVLMYHGIPQHAAGSGLDAIAFEDHIRFLKRNFDLISPCQMNTPRQRGSRARALLTFDDGFRNNAQVAAPILRRHNVPAIFFISSRHAVDGSYLWFAYLRMLAQHFTGDGFMFRGQLMDMSQLRRAATIAHLTNVLLDLKPHPAAMYDEIETELPALGDFVDPIELNGLAAGMTSEHLVELAKNELFSFGVHTVDHPLLTRCDKKEAIRQILDNKVWIETATKRPCYAIAYPLQDFNSRTIELCKHLGLRQGYSVTKTLNCDPAFEIPRVGVYKKSLDRLGLKVRWATILR